MADSTPKPVENGQQPKQVGTPRTKVQTVQLPISIFDQHELQVNEDCDDVPVDNAIDISYNADDSRPGSKGKLRRRAVRRGFTVKVWGYPENATFDDIKTLSPEAASVSTITDTGIQCALFQYSTRHEAKKAAASLKSAELLGQKVHVLDINSPVDQNELIVVAYSMQRTSLTAEEIKNAFPEVTFVRVVKKFSSTLFFLTFDSSDAAAKTAEKLQTDEGIGSEIQVFPNYYLKNRKVMLLQKLMNRREGDEYDDVKESSIQMWNAEQNSIGYSKSQLAALDSGITQVFLVRDRFIIRALSTSYAYLKYKSRDEAVAAYKRLKGSATLDEMNLCIAHPDFQQDEDERSLVASTPKRLRANAVKRLHPGIRFVILRNRSVVVTFNGPAEAEQALEELSDVCVGNLTLEFRRVRPGAGKEKQHSVEAAEEMKNSPAQEREKMSDRRPPVRSRRFSNRRSYRSEGKENTSDKKEESPVSETKEATRQPEKRNNDTKDRIRQRRVWLADNRDRFVKLWGFSASVTQEEIRDLDPRITDVVLSIDTGIRIAYLLFSTEEDSRIAYDNLKGLKINEDQLYAYHPSAVDSEYRRKVISLRRLPMSTKIADIKDVCPDAVFVHMKVVRRQGTKSASIIFNTADEAERSYPALAAAHIHGKKIQAVMLEHCGFCLLLSDLPSTTTPEGVSKLIPENATVKALSLSAVIEFNSLTDCQEGIKKLRNSNIDGKQLSVRRMPPVRYDKPDVPAEEPSLE